MAAYQAEVEVQLAQATTYAYQVQTALQQCQDTSTGSNLAGTLLRAGVPLLLQGLGLPSSLRELIDSELDR